MGSKRSHVAIPLRGEIYAHKQENGSGSQQEYRRDWYAPRLHAVDRLGLLGHHGIGEQFLMTSFRAGDAAVVNDGAFIADGFAAIFADAYGLIIPVSVANHLTSSAWVVYCRPRLEQ
ncbi:MAG TPA: hypothetical protein PKJ56_06465 [Promineifilum sp.]|nr:hypothetical protein [Promineifilum sp.]